MTLDSVKNRKIWFGWSGIMILASLIFVIQSLMTFGAPVRPGLDFTGGTKLEYNFNGAYLAAQELELNSEDIQKLLVEIGLKSSRAQVSEGANPSIIIKTRAISDDPILDDLNTKLESNFGSFEIASIDTVSPIIGPELFQSGLIALIFTIMGIIVYISNRFKRDYAISAIIALCHDVFIVLGLFAFLGVYFGVEVESLFITALLSTFGFSVHDTIVVFDRIRENQKLETTKFSFLDVANLSVNQISTRSINTSLTTLTVLGFLFFFGGASTKMFVAALFVGLFVGTYSSLFLASPLLVNLRKAKA